MLPSQVVGWNKLCSPGSHSGGHGGGVKCGALSGLVSFWAPSIVKNVEKEHIAVACLLSFAF